MGQFTLSRRSADRETASVVHHHCQNLDQPYKNMTSYSPLQNSVFRAFLAEISHGQKI